jgi:plastocyanin
MKRMTIGLLLALGAACGTSSSDGQVNCMAADATATSSVAIQGMAYVPACVKVAMGTTVTFTNDDGVLHTVTTDAGQPETFNSPSIAVSGGVFQHTFTVVGTTHIHCNFHSNMHMAVIVQ